MKHRITVIDGYRAVAVMGVLWAHIWMFLGNPAFRIAGVDIAGLIGFFGTGVDLFFVISGFVMYNMYRAGNKEINLSFFLEFLRKRWLRIAPAFYVALVVYLLVAYFNGDGSFNWSYLLANISFVNTLIGISGPGTHFWSLCTEWHFYFLLPFLLYFFKQLSFKTGVLIFCVVFMAFRFYVWRVHEDSLNIINYAIPNRILEFIFGIVAGHLYLYGTVRWKKIFANPLFFIAGIGIAFAGRILMTAQFNYRTDMIGHLARTMDIILLSFGYAMMVLHSLHSGDWITSILNSRFFQYVGKISYSMYLWHWIIAATLASWYGNYFSMHGFYGTNLVFVASLLILIPVSAASYTIFEAFYFKRKQPKELSKVTS